MSTMVPDRSNDPRRVPGSYMSLVNKAKMNQSKVAEGDNPRWKCRQCGGKGAQDYHSGTGPMRLCKSCAEGAGL